MGGSVPKGVEEKERMIRECTKKISHGVVGITEGEGKAPCPCSVEIVARGLS